MVALVLAMTMPPACHYSVRLSGRGTQCSQGQNDPGVPLEDDSVDLGDGKTGLFGHGAVDDMVS